MPNRAEGTPEWSSRILDLLKKLRLSQAGLATRLGVSPATMTRWVKGTHEPTSASYLAMGNLAGLPAGTYFWERAGVDPANFPSSDLQLKLTSLRANIKDFRVVRGTKLARGVAAGEANGVLLPLLNITAYGDRVPPPPHITLSQANVVDLLVAPLAWCPHPENMLCMHMSGDSMYPLIPSDSVITVDTATTGRDQLDKKIAVFSHRDLGFKVARLQRLSAADILVSANHQVLPVDVTDQSKWKAIGQVVWWVSKDVVTEPAARKTQLDVII
jgi:transcriptional regulator with XRE-family HTH domain